MSGTKTEELTGTVGGGYFTTDPLEFPPPPDEAAAGGGEGKEAVRVRWNDGAAWRLRFLGQGNTVEPLPGKDQLFTPDRPQQPRTPKILIVAAARNSGLSSFHHWLEAGPRPLRALSVNLADAQLKGRDPEDKLKAIAELLRREAEKLGGARPQEGGDPIEILLDVAGWSEKKPEALILRNFETLDRQTAERFFGRLRHLYENPSRPRSGMILVLLGHSVEALDPVQHSEVSSLLTLGSFYTLTPLYREEVEDMLAVARGSTASQRRHRKEDPELETLLSWTGGHPLLVQAVLERMTRPKDAVSLDEAIELMGRERLQAFNTWVDRLVSSLDNFSIRRIVETLLSRDRFLRTGAEDRYAALELLVQGWIRLDAARGDRGAWIFSSDCHKMLAAEAFARRKR